MTATTPGPAPRPGAPFGAMLRGAFLPATVVGVVAAAAYQLAQGSEAGWSALMGAGVTIGFFSLGMFLLSTLVRSASPHAFFAVAMAVYLGQVLGLMLFIYVFKDAEWINGRALGLTALLVTVAWQAFAMIALRKARIPVYDEPSDPA